MTFDLNSKWLEFVPTGTVTSQVIIDFLESLFLRWGLPDTSTTDNSPQLVTAEFTTYLAHRGIRPVCMAYYHPQANGGMERFHQPLKNGLKAHMAQRFSFLQAIRRTLLHYRTTQHATTGVSPSFLMVGREMNMPLDRLLLTFCLKSSHFFGVNFTPCSL